jgi:hypothetical protein
MAKIQGRVVHAYGQMMDPDEGRFDGAGPVYRLKLSLILDGPADVKAAEGVMLDILDGDLELIATIEPINNPRSAAASRPRS